MKTQSLDRFRQWSSPPSSPPFLLTMLSTLYSAAGLATIVALQATSVSAGVHK